MIEHAVLCDLVRYEPDTGNFVWIKSRPGAKAGNIAGWRDINGYCSIKIKRVVYLQHRLAFFYTQKRWPLIEIDHKDGNRSNNKWENLREATRAENAVNRKATTEFKGAIKQPNGRWMARIRFAGDRIYLGLFDTVEEAHKAYMNKAKELYGEFACG